MAPPVATLSGPCIVFALLFLSTSIPTANCTGGVFRVKTKWASHHLEDLKKHDVHRHARLLSGISPVDLPIGSGLPGMYYYANIRIGTPPKNYTVQIDTGSSLLWVNCQGCIGCYPNDDPRGTVLQPYDPNTSKTAEIQRISEERCKGSESPELCRNTPAPFGIKYVDGTEVGGYYVRDLISYEEVEGHNLTRTVTGNVKFGCADHHVSKAQDLMEVLQKVGIDGLIGLGNDEISIITQLAATGKVRKEFAHCLDGTKNGGIFAIGHVIKPSVKMTPFDPLAEYGLYTTRMTSVEVGDKVVELDSIGVDNSAVIDCGAYSVFLPDKVYDYLLENTINNRPNLHIVEQESRKCFNFSGNLDDVFPAITFHFQQSAALKVRPSYYLQRGRNEHKQQVCFVFNRSEQKRTNKGFLVGLVALADKLVVYDLENKTVGFTDYDCGSSIEVEDDKGGVCTIHAHQEEVSNPPSTN